MIPKKTSLSKYLVLVLFMSLSMALWAQGHAQILTIAISKERSIEGKKYSEWLAHQRIPFRYIDLSLLPFEVLDDSLQHCNALLLTGGADIHPARYERESDTTDCGPFDVKRDQYEFEAFRWAKAAGMPILGICRGMQLINVAEGGKLWIDLPTYTGSGSMHREGQEGWTVHEIEIREGNLLHHLANESIQQVASNHHQGIEILAPGLTAIAFSPDGLTEAIAGSDIYPNFFLAVQWHPEWMDKNDQLSGAIATSFLNAALQFSKKE